MFTLAKPSLIVGGTAYWNDELSETETGNWYPILPIATNVHFTVKVPDQPRLKS